MLSNHPFYLRGSPLKQEPVGFNVWKYPLRSSSFQLSFLFLQLLLEKQKLLEMQLHLRLSEGQQSDSVCSFCSLFKVCQSEFNQNF